MIENIRKVAVVNGKKVIGYFIASLVGLNLLSRVTYLSKAPTSIEVCPPVLHDLIDSNILQELNNRLKTKTTNTIDDASCLNKTNVFAIVQPSTEQEIKDILSFAKEHKKAISLAAVRHSMGGQTMAPDALVIDMMKFNQILSLDQQEKLITVQTGTTWKQIQNYIDDFGLSVQAMQSSNIFSVGGSMSVNAHGMDHRAGSVADTVMSFRIMIADGTIKNCSRLENQELFWTALGGYGLFGNISK